MNLPYATDSIPLGICIGAVVLIAGAIITARLIRRHGFDGSQVIVIIGTVGLSVLAVAGTVVAGTPSLTDARERWMEDTYGVQFSAAQYAELEFPTFAAPDREREVYGLTTGNRDNQLVTVQLVWEDSQFILIGDDGKQLDALATR